MEEAAIPSVLGQRLFHVYLYQKTTQSPLETYQTSLISNKILNLNEFPVNAHC